MLDYGNPSMKSQIKQVAAVEGDLFFFWGIFCVVCYNCCCFCCLSLTYMEETVLMRNQFEL